MMIRLFRKIRAKLLSENTYSTYILYASGEIVLVMIGILLALQINNWNEERVQKRKANTQLENLIEALEKDIERLNAVQTVNDFRSKSLNYMLIMAGYNTLSTDTLYTQIDSSSIWNGRILNDTLDTQLIEQGFIWSFRNNPFSTNRMAIDEIMNTGMFSHIDKELIKSINHYYERTGWAYNDGWENMDISRMKEFQDYVRDEFGILLRDVSATGRLFVRLQADPQFALRINELAYLAGARKHSAKITKEMALNLVKEIDKVLPDSNKSPNLTDDK
jgi:hypothetical protein